MRIAIVGAGALGSVLAAYLVQGREHDVSLVARGTRLAALRTDGLVVESRGQLLRSRPPLTDDPGTLGPQDLLIVAVKGYSLPALAPRLVPLLRKDTLIVCAQNGIPWWYFHGVGPREEWMPFLTVDAGAAAWRSLGPEHAIGCVVNAAAEVDDAGTVRHNGNLRLTLGAPRPPDHEDALETIVQALRDCGIDARATSTIRAAVWTKLQNNLASAPAGVLTGATMGPLIEAPGMALLRERLMRECLAVAHAYGVDLIDDIAARARAPSPAPNHKPSMLQDYEAGRPLEIDAQITAVAELAERRQVAVPLVETLLALVRLKSSTIVGATDNHAER